MKNLFLLLCALRGAWMRKKNALRPPERVVVIQLAQLGDLVCTTPVFRAIKERYPKCHLAVSAKEEYRELLAGDGDIDEYIGFRGDAGALARTLRSGRFDFGCSVTLGFLPLAVLLAAHIPHVAAPYLEHGYSPQQTRSYRWLLRHATRVPYRFGAYIPRLMLNLLAPIGIFAEDTKKHLAHTPEDARMVSELISRSGIQPGHFIVGMSVSSGNKVKNWGTEKFAQLARNILDDDPNTRILVVGSAADQKELEAFRGAIPVSERVMYAIDFPLGQVKALLAACSLFISVDTGPVYIAEAFNVPTIDIVGPVASEEQPPRDGLHVVVEWAERAAPAIHILNARDYDFGEARRQVDSIAVADVFSAYAELRKRIAQGPRNEA